jgi:hypothetical protein
MKPKRIHLSIHIERTGGTTLMGALETLYGAEHVLLYKAGKDKFIRMSDVPVLSPAHPLLNKIKNAFEGTPVLHFFYTIYIKFVQRSDKLLPWIDLDAIPEDIAALHGHFELDQVESRFENPYTTVILREPLERMVSQFLHWRKTGGRPGWRVSVPFDEKITFEQYAFRSEFANYQTRALGGKSVAEIDLVGITPYTNAFIKALLGKKNKRAKIISVNQLMHKPGYRKLGITQQMVERFRDVNALDYRNYELATERVGEYLSSKYGSKKKTPRK